MLRNKAFTVLQKTYDDSYLSCSTAVYYESQGDESEAMRHWKTALDLIYEYHATKVIPTQGSQTDTEKALLEALKQLELQCKERIDLLEALRVSRQNESDLSAGSAKEYSKATETHTTMNSLAKGSIGQGSIPAVTYSELSRPLISSTRTPSDSPLLTNSPLLPTALSSDNVGKGGNRSATTSTASRAFASKPHSLSVLHRQDKTARSPSPEKHTMRTTLRHGKPSNKSTRITHKYPQPAAEGPSKAATLAWSALGSRDPPLRVRSPAVDSGLSGSTPSPRQSVENLSKPISSQYQWDSHSRRLLSPREAASSPTRPVPSSKTRHLNGCSSSSVLSVSAASSALNSSVHQESLPVDQHVDRPERSHAPRAVTGNKLTKLTNKLKSHDSSAGANDPGDTFDRQNPTDVPTGRRAPGRRSRDISQVEKDSHQTSIHAELPETRSISRTTGDDGDISAANKNNIKGKKDIYSKTNSYAQPSEEVEGFDVSSWKKKKAAILKSLPSGVDESSAKQILNDIIVKGDEVRWEDIAGLEVAKNALRETVVYPFLRPDLFMGLREPARGMLLFGPPGTGKTMLARAVATESRSTFFSISASSLTSKYLGESEKLVKALFGLARALAPSIIFVDEIDSLLSQRSGSGEHEATRRIKTEFLIQWSDLQRAAAGREASNKDRERGDANRVLVLAATNLPWAIDEAARRRFVRRQYIPLPEAQTRESQLRRLLGEQKHSLSDTDIQILVKMTDGFSGSDITALAKDAAMGPLRSLGDALLHMTMDDIRSIALIDFKASLGTIRPSVSRSGLKEYETWAEEFGERGG